MLSWFNKSSKFEGFNDNELLWLFSRSFHCVMFLSVLVQQARKFLLLDKKLKGKIVEEKTALSLSWTFFAQILQENLGVNITRDVSF